jgi:hypothetical protein
MIVKDPIPPFIVARFRKHTARPRVVRGYTVQTGWVQISKGPELTEDAVRQLKRAGYSMIEARWRRQTREISLVQLP